ncbi:hypothetical protein WJX72_005829 [[Myrmecia] bisecta]|uniref:Uncharacterized protein n=1 Tax=[Myrmecia] bisecta TaxID=41462 RepID=A0AAW1PD58_9CHLO
MALSRFDFERKWRGKANAVPEAKRGRDLKGLLYQYEVMDHLDSILRHHQGPLSDMPEALHTKLLVSLLHAYLQADKQLHFSEAVSMALPHLLKPHILSVCTTPEGGQSLSFPSNAGLENFQVMPQSLLKASMAIVFYQMAHMSDLVLLLSGIVTVAIQELLSPQDTAQLQALLQRHEPDFGIKDLLWVVAYARASAALTATHTRLLETKAAALDMIRLKPDMPVAHAMIGHVFMEFRDMVSACKYLEQGLQVADQTGDQWNACLLRFELAYALLTGAH